MMLKRRSWEVPGKFWHEELMKVGVNQLDRHCEKWRCITKSQGK